MDLQDTAGREAYLRRGLEKLEMACVRSLELGLEEPVALLLDPTDEDAPAAGPMTATIPATRFAR